MKQTTHLRSAPQTPLYPNAADANYFADKALEILAGLVAGAGTVTAMLFLLTVA